MDMILRVAAHPAEYTWHWEFRGRAKDPARSTKRRLVLFVVFSIVVHILWLGSAKVGTGLHLDSPPVMLAALTSFCFLRLKLLRGSVCLRNLRIGLARGKCLESPYLVGNKHWQGKRFSVGPTLSSSAAQDGARLGLIIHFVSPNCGALGSFDFLALRCVSGFCDEL